MILVLIPCYNEAQTLGQTIAELQALGPTLLGHALQLMVVDDGSTDSSIEVAMEAGVQVSPGPHLGLAGTFSRGLRLARRSACAVVVDADGQYDVTSLEKLVAPVLAGRADLVIAERSGWRKAISPSKAAFHALGTAAVRLLTGVDTQDPVSGYRAYSPRAVEELQVKSRYTYTLETLAQVRPLGLRLLTVQLPARPVARPSRLVRSVPSYVWRQGVTLLVATVRYRLPWGVGARTRFAALR